MDGPLTVDIARLYRLQVREVEEFAMFLIRPDGRLTSWNRGVEALFGYREDEWIGQESAIIFRPEDRDAGVPNAELSTAAEQGRASDVRWHLRKDGSLVHMQGVVRGLRGDDGSLLGYCKVVLDDTPRKRLQDALTESNRNLEQFAFIASHDLQEPLRTISTYAELVREACGQCDAEIVKMLGFLVDATERMSGMVADLLAYSRLASEEGKAISARLDEDLGTAISLLRTSIEETGAVIVHDPLPNIEFQRAPLVRLFQNLLSNSIKFRKKDTPPKVHVSAERRGQEWVIRVADNGIGFPQEQADAIFAPFQRLHSTDEYPGSGIGLAMCKRIVERLGGTIGAEGRPGEGATIWFTLPAKEKGQPTISDRLP